MPGALRVLSNRTRTLVLRSLVCVLAAGSATAPLNAQAPLVIEGRAGVITPVGGFRTGPEQGGELAGGASFGVGFALERSGGLHLTLGFSQHRFDCEADGCAGDGLYVATAWDLGARWDFGSGAVVPWVRAGATVPRVERDRPEPDEADVTELGIGAEAGAGARIAVAGRFHLSPGVRFGAADTGLRSGGTLRMRYLVFDVGLVVGF